MLPIRHAALVELVLVGHAVVRCHVSQLPHSTVCVVVHNVVVEKSCCSFGVEVHRNESFEALPPSGPRLRERVEIGCDVLPH